MEDRGGPVAAGVERVLHEARCVLLSAHARTVERCVTLLLGAYELLLAQVVQPGGDRGVRVLGSELIDARAHRQGVALPQQVHHLCLEVAQADRFARRIVAPAARRAARHGAVSTFSCGVEAFAGSGQEIWAGSRHRSASPVRMSAPMASTGWIGANQVIAPE